MHILFYSNWYIKQTVQLANALAEQHRVTLIFPEYSSELNAYDGRVDGLREILAENVQLITLPHMQNLTPHGWKPVWETRRLMRELKPDVVHFNESYDFRCLLLMLLCPGIPYITSVHDPIPHSDENISLQKFKHWVRDQIRRRADGCVVHGKKFRQILSDYSHIPIEKVFLVPHGEYKFFSHFDRGGEQQRNGRKNVLFFGRWEYYKGIDVLVDAEPLITDRVPEAQIVLAGEGRLPFSELEPKIVHPDKFVVKNYSIPDEEVPDLFRTADVVVLPYREATQSGPLHIAGSYARPSVVTRVGAMPEVVRDGETGILIDPEDPRGLADAVCRLLQDPVEAERMGQAALASMAAEESMEQVAQAQTECYSSVLQAKAASRKQGFLMKGLQALVKRLKRDPNYALDQNLRFGDLVAMLTKLSFALTRGMIQRPLFEQVKGLSFIGCRVKIRNRRHIRLGRNFVAEDGCEIQGLSSRGISFGDNVTVGSYSMVRPSGYYGREIGVGLEVGDRSNIGPYCYLGASGGIRIGANVMMGPRVSLFAENHNFERTDIPMREQGVSRQEIVVEDDCWLASGSVILAGVTIGKGSIIAAGAVVTKDVPPYSIVGGNPAKIIRSRREAE